MAPPRTKARLARLRMPFKTFVVQASRLGMDRRDGGATSILGRTLGLACGVILVISMPAFLEAQSELELAWPTTQPAAAQPTSADEAGGKAGSGVVGDAPGPAATQPAGRGDRSSPEAGPAGRTADPEPRRQRH